MQATRCLFIRAVAIIVALGVSAGASRASAQECRTPTPQEKKALETLIDAANRAIRVPLAAAGWQPQDDESSADGHEIASRPAPMRPLMTCEPVFDVKFHIDPSSTRGKELQSRAETLAHEETSDAAQKMFEVLESGRVQVNIDANDPYLRSRSSQPLEKFVVPGAALAFRVVDPIEPAESRSSVCYGNWAGFPIDRNEYIAFPFAHRQSGPYIENACVIIIGRDAVAREVLKIVDWKLMEHGLTK